LITDQYAGYNAVLDAKVYPLRKSAVCAAHARRYFEELSRGGSSASAVASEAMQRWARIYHAEGALAEMDEDNRQRARQHFSKPLWDEFEVWLKLQRAQVLDGGKIAQAIDYSLNAWKGLTLHLDDGKVVIDNNLIERQIKPWKLGANNANSAFMRSRHGKWRRHPGSDRLRTPTLLRITTALAGTPTGPSARGTALA
jgi:transposase